MDHTTFFAIPAPARYPVAGSPGNVVGIPIPPHHPIEDLNVPRRHYDSQDVLQPIGPSLPQQRTNRLRRQIRLGQKPGRRAGLDQIGELLPSMSRDQNHTPRVHTALLY